MQLIFLNYLCYHNIGPKDYLMSKGINVLRDVPAVGLNLMDHVALGGIIFTINDNRYTKNRKSFKKCQLYTWLFDVQGQYQYQVEQKQ